ncbi:hypothetical protein Nmel_003457, partial [Mimus melanotis]
ENPHNRLEKALYTINHLTVQQDSNNPVIENHFVSLQASDGTRLPQVKVFVRDLTTNKWDGPHELIVWVCWYTCVSTDTGVRWLPARCVSPDV